MAGQPGRSGGARPGAGRPPKEPTILELAHEYDDPLEFLRAVMNNDETDLKTRVDAAKAQLAYVHRKAGEQTRKTKEAEAAKAASQGPYSTGKAPVRLVANNK